MLSLYHVILLVSFLGGLFPLRNESFQFSLTLIVVFNYSFIQGRGCYSTFGWAPSIASLIILLQLLLSNVIKKSE